MSRLPNSVKGVGVLDQYWTYDRLYATDTSVTEAEPKPGTMETSDTYAALVPQTTGAQAVSMTVQTIASGLPRLGFGVDASAEVGYWLTDTETSADLRYLDEPTKISDWQKPHITISAPDSSDAAMFPLSGKVAMYWKDSTGVGANHFSVWDPYTESFQNTQALTGRPTSAFVVIPGTERLIRISWETSGDHGNEYTDDYGATWVTYTDGDARPNGPWAVSSDFAPHKKIRAAFDAAGNLLLCGIDTVDASIDLFTSPDNGVSWVESFLLAALLDYDVCTLKDGSIGFAYVSNAGSCVFSRMASAYDSPLDSTRTVPFDGSTAFGALTFDSCYLAVDSHGVIWIWAQNDADHGAWCVAASSDNGATWFSDWYVRTPYFWSWGTAAQRPASFRFAPDGVRGGLVCAASFGVYGTGVGVGGMVRWGEWRSNPILGKIFGAKSGTDVDRIWVGYLRPQDGPVWTITGTATTTIGTDGGLTINSTAGALAGDYTANLSAAGRTHAQGKFGVLVSNDGGSALGIGYKLTTKSSASNKRAVATVYLQSDGFRVRDDVAGSFLAAKVSVDLTVRTHFEVDVDVSNAVVTVCYRQDGSTKYTKTTWTGLTTAATAANSGDADWGQLTGVANASSTWYYVEARAPDVAAGDLQPRAATGLSTDIDGTYPIPDLQDSNNERPGYLTLRGGFSMIGETFAIDVAPDYPLSAVFSDTEPSPDRRWRSTAVGVAQDIAIDRGSDGLSGSWSIALLVMGANCQKWSLAGKEDGGSSYTSLATLNLATGFESVGFSRTGQIVVPGTGSAGARYIQDGECGGGHVIFDPSGTPVARRIGRTVAGFWDVNATGPRAVLFIEDIDGTEPTSGNITIVWPSGVLVFHASESAMLRRYIRVRCLAANNSPDSYYSAGVVALYGLRAYGKDWGNGWEIDQLPNVIGARDAYGTERRKPMGPDVRTLTKSWDHGLKLDRMRGQTDADYIGAAGAAALAAQDEVWQRLVSIWRDTDQGSKPALVLFEDPGSGNTLTDPTKWLYAYPDGSVHMQQSNGLDDEGFFMRAGPVRFVEVK